MHAAMATAGPQNRSRNRADSAPPCHPLLSLTKRRLRAGPKRPRRPRNELRYIPNCPRFARSGLPAAAFGPTTVAVAEFTFVSTPVALLGNGACYARVEFFTSRIHAPDIRDSCAWMAHVLYLRLDVLDIGDANDVRGHTSRSGSRTGSCAAWRRRP